MKQNSKKTIGVGLLGLGTVGSGVLKILTKNESLIFDRTGLKFEIKKICVRDLKKKREVSVSSSLLTTKPEEIISDPQIDVVVELMGGLEPSRSLLMKAIASGKQVVTANKALLAEHGAEIFGAAREKGIHIGFEAAVAGGIPIVKAIREGFVGNDIYELYGIINGTSNFILSEMTEKKEEFEKVLQEAQKAGYAEADPSFDIDGIDAAQKLSILLSLCYGVPPPEKNFFVEGIRRITPLDIEFAQKLGYTIKLLAISKEHPGAVEARVHPTMIPLNHPLSDVRGAYNALFLRGDAVGESMFWGLGAGMTPTASAVVSDLVMVSLGLTMPERLAKEKLKIQAIEDLKTEYYLRVLVRDSPGVLAKIAKILGDQEISIASVYQQERDLGAKVPIVLMTHESKEKNMQAAVKEIDQLESVLEKAMLIRVERLGR